ncbi:Protein of unknown function [Chitinophaga sp. CF118]|uniref:DUF4238 domain-containing protein n=1 Tax=Chitinophaga sp. CF118 TaxID=1884367 RepID=UPI0008F0A34C|nr:DUF4238 domain-containing protein [Chitinophaga sp. CF118]SFE63951.1 Protein of unknown function [Chitinophaga sp. CF118]
MNNPTWRHHFTPECYLKNFTTDGKLFALNVTNLLKNWKVVPEEKTPAQISYSKNFYLVKPVEFPNALTLQAPHELYIEQDVFRELENEYEGMYQEIIQEPQLSLEVANFICKFIVHLKLRNPYHLENTLKKQKSSLLQQAIDSIVTSLEGSERAHRIPPIAVELAKALVFEDYNNNPDTAMNMFQSSLANRFQDPDGYKVFQDALLKCTWRIFKAPATGPKFLTTDNPGVSVGRDNKIYNTRYHDGFMLLFPLSKDYCLTIDDYEIDSFFDTANNCKTVTHLIATESIVMEMNNFQIQKYKDLLISTDEKYLQLLAEANKPKGE